MDNNRKEVINCLLLILQIGIGMMVPVCLGGFLGWLVGRRLSADYVLLIGFVLGAAAGYRNVYYMLKKYMKNPPQPESARKPSEEEIRRMKAEEEFRRWRRERDSDDDR